LQFISNMLHFAAHNSTTSLSHLKASWVGLL
jgi:hypothetical protein